MIEKYSNLLGVNDWVTKVIFVLIVVISINIFTKVILINLKKQIELTENNWDDALVSSLFRPITFIVWMLGIIFTVQLFNENEHLLDNSFISNLKKSTFVIGISLFLYSFSKHLQELIIEKNISKNIDFDDSTIEAISKLARLSILIIATLILLQTFGLSISGVLAFGGIGGLAIGFAAKDLLSNFFGGLIIYLDKPFKKGDWIRSPDRDLEGVVVEIGWRQTIIKNFKRNMIYVPNSIFASVIIENPSRMSHRRIHECIGLRYQDISKIGNIIKDVREMINKHSDIDTSQSILVAFNSFNSSSIDFFIRAYTNPVEWEAFHLIKEDILFKIHEIISEHNADIAFPSRTVYVENSN